MQVVVTCLSWDGENDPDIPAMIAASFALSVSNIPWNGPLGAIRIGRDGDKTIFNPTYKQRTEGDIDLTLSAIEVKNKVLINMIEMGAKEFTEDDVLKVIKMAQETLLKIINFQKKIVAKLGKEKATFESAVESGVESEIRKFLGDKLEKAITNAEPGEKNLGQVENLKEELVKFI